MHDCPNCGMACDCDGEDTWLPAPVNCLCDCEDFEEEPDDDLDEFFFLLDLTGGEPDN